MISYAGTCMTDYRSNNEIKKYKQYSYKYSKTVFARNLSIIWKKTWYKFTRDDWPNYYSKSKGIHIWDLNNKKYLDFSMVGIGTSVLGYSNKKIVNKAKKTSLLKRDYKKLYKNAIQGKIKNVVGVDLPFNTPRGCDLHIENNLTKNVLYKNIEQIFKRIEKSKIKIY